MQGPALFKQGSELISEVDYLRGCNLSPGMLVRLHATPAGELVTKALAETIAWLHVHCPYPTAGPLGLCKLPLA